MLTPIEQKEIIRKKIDYMMQFVYVTFFAPAVPLAPILAMVLNRFDIKWRLYNYIYVK